MPKLLDYLKEKNLSHEDVIKLIEKQDDKPDLKTREELESELLKAKTKLKEESEKKDDDEEEEEEEEEKPKTELKKLTDSLEKMAKEIVELKKSAIKRKTPGKAVKTKEEDLPEELTIKIQKNMFETMV